MDEISACLARAHYKGASDTLRALFRRQILRLWEMYLERAYRPRMEAQAVEETNLLDPSPKR